MASRPKQRIRIVWPDVSTCALAAPDFKADWRGDTAHPELSSESREGRQQGREGILCLLLPPHSPLPASACRCLCLSASACLPLPASVRLLASACLCLPRSASACLWLSAAAPVSCQPAPARLCLPFPGSAPAAAVACLPLPASACLLAFTCHCLPRTAADCFRLPLLACLPLPPVYLPAPARLCFWVCSCLIQVLNVFMCRPCPIHSAWHLPSETS